MNSSASQEPRPAAHFARVERRPPESCGPSTRQDRRASIAPLPPVKRRSDMGHHGYMKPQLSGADVMLRTPSKLAVRPPRPPVILAVPAESRPSRHAVASRAWTRRPRPRAGSYEEDGAGAGHEAPPNQYRSAYDRRAISGPLAGH